MNIFVLLLLSYYYYFVLIQTSETFNELRSRGRWKDLYTPAGIDQFFVKSSFTIEGEVILLDQTRGNKPRCHRQCISQCTLPDESHVETRLARKKVIFLSSSEHSSCIAVPFLCYMKASSNQVKYFSSIILRIRAGLPPFSLLQRYARRAPVISCIRKTFVFGAAFFPSSDQRTGFEVETRIAQNVPVIMVQTGERWFYFE